MNSYVSNTKENSVTNRQDIAELFELPFNDLMLQAQQVLRENFPANTVQASTLLSIKTGNCPEDCDYCSQSGHHNAELEKEKKLEVAKVIAEAKKAKANGASRFCMGAAWRNPHERDMPYVTELVREVKSLGLETCMTLGMLSQSQATQLAEAGLDYYNHNIDTSRKHYANIIRTRTFDDRLETLQNVRDSGMKICSGGIVGMGESRDDRIDMLAELASLPLPPESVPINLLVPVKGTPLGDKMLDESNVEFQRLPTLEWIRTIAVARICLPTSYIRLSAGRESLSDAEQAMAFMAGANSFFYGDKLLTTPNSTENHDDALMAELGLTLEAPKVDIRMTAVDAVLNL